MRLKIEIPGYCTLITDKVVYHSQTLLFLKGFDIINRQYTAPFKFYYPLVMPNESQKDFDVIHLIVETKKDDIEWYLSDTTIISKI